MGYTSAEILLFIAAIGSIVVNAIQAWRTGKIVSDTKDNVVATKNLVVAEVDKSLNRDLKLESIESLVDGRYSEVLKELATLRQTVADKSGTKADKAAAVEAHTKADNQEKRVQLARDLDTSLQKDK